MPTQFGAISGGLNKRRYPYSADIRQRASYLPQQYAQRQQQEYDDRSMELAESQLAFGKESFQNQQDWERERFAQESALAQSQFDWQRGEAEKAEGIARGSLGLQAGMGLMKFAPQAIDKVDSLAGGIGGFLGDDKTDLSAHEQFRLTGKSPSEGGMFSDIELGAGLVGGATGGLVAGGAAGALGVRKKSTKALIGAAGGMAGAWLSGSDDLLSTALGGIVGGGLGLFM